MRQAKPKIQDSIKSFIENGEGKEWLSKGSAIRNGQTGRGCHEQDKDLDWEMDQEELTVSN